MEINFDINILDLHEMVVVTENKTLKRKGWILLEKMLDAAIEKFDIEVNNNNSVGHVSDDDNVDDSCNISIKLEDLTLGGNITYRFKSGNGYPPNRLIVYSHFDIKNKRLVFREIHSHVVYEFDTIAKVNEVMYKF